MILRKGREDNHRLKFFFPPLSQTLFPPNFPSHPCPGRALRLLAETGASSACGSCSGVALNWMPIWPCFACRLPVRYYLPPLRKRIGIPDIQRALLQVGVRTPADCLDNVCDCAICKGAIGDDVSRLRAFGEMHRANAESKRDSQTPTAAKLSRFHFLMNRIREKSAVAGMRKEDRAKQLLEMAATWCRCPSIRAALDEDSGGESHIDRWAAALT